MAVLETDDIKFILGVDWKVIKRRLDKIKVEPADGPKEGKLEK